MTELKKQLLLSLLILIALTAPCGARALDRTIARINDTILTESDLAETIAEMAGLHRATGINAFARATTDTVASMLDRALLLQEARRMQIQPRDQELHRQVENMVQEIKQSFASEKEFFQALAEERLSLDQLKDQLLEQTRDDFMVYHVVDSRYSISEAEMSAAQGSDAQTTPSSFRLRRLGIAITKQLDARAAARKAHATVAQTITEGISFEEGVRRYSQVPGAAQDGGDMGFVSTDKLSADVRKAVEGLDVGQASAPVIAGGFANVFYVENKRGERVALREKKFIETRNELLKSLRRRAVLQVYDDRLTPLLIPEYRNRLTGAGSPVSTSRAAVGNPTGAAAQTPRPPIAPPPASPYHQQYTIPQATPTPTPTPRPFWRGWGRQSAIRKRTIPLQARLGVTQISSRAPLGSPDIPVRASL
jgi:parvulin-like peptidyl-prolyl isomerase